MPADMEVKVLADHEIYLAQSLCYEVLVLEQSWVIHSNNPTQLEVKVGRLCDIYDSVATWFGVFEANHLIACHRNCIRLNGFFELEHYHDLPEFIQQDELAIEGTRLAVRKESRSSLAILQLIRFEFKYLLQQGFNTLFTTGFFPKPGNFYIRKFGLIKYGNPFRYHANDPKEVYLFYIKSREMQETVNKLSNVLDHHNNLV